jgi:hypothetical protein
VIRARAVLIVVYVRTKAGDRNRQSKYFEIGQFWMVMCELQFGYDKVPRSSLV